MLQHLDMDRVGEVVVENQIFNLKKICTVCGESLCVRGDEFIATKKGWSRVSNVRKSSN